MVSFASTLSDKIKNYKKKCPFIFNDPPLPPSYLEASLVNKALWKSSIDWQSSDLDYFNIRIKNTNFKDFFNEEIPSYDDFNEQVKEFINCDPFIGANCFTRQKIDWSTAVKSSLARNVVKNLTAVINFNYNLSVVGNLSAVNNLSHSLLQLFDYDADDRVIRRDKDIFLKPSFILEPQYLYTFIPNLSIESMREKHIKFVQENSFNDYNQLGHSFPNSNILPEETKFVADTIAAFLHNFRMHHYYKKSKTFKSKQWIPGIIMLRARPMFLLMNMTEDLLFSVGKGEPPLKETIVKQYLVPPPESYSSEITKGLRDQRLHIASCYKAFRKFVM
ncbi:hypothetical protein BJ944DRAFT_237804 [Cunninghamella echinulata]|nr:hypothetical protein BJ944DRAFT_237804 [Cunninghamella echinulata]